MIFFTTRKEVAEMIYPLVGMIEQLLARVVKLEKTIARNTHEEGGVK
jgi:hypothetical protein